MIVVPIACAPPARRRRSLPSRSRSTGSSTIRGWRRPPTCGSTVPCSSRRCCVYALMCVDAAPGHDAPPRAQPAAAPSSAGSRSARRGCACSPPARSSSGSSSRSCSRSLCPLGVAVRTARAGRDLRAAAAAALASGLVGGLLAFVVWVTVTYLQAGGPYDAQLVRDFHASGAHDLASFAVADDLSMALGLLVVDPDRVRCVRLYGGLVNRPRGAGFDGLTPFSPSRSGAPPTCPSGETRPTRRSCSTSGCRRR